VLRPGNAYVAEFVQHMNPLNVLTGAMIMRGASELARETTASGSTTQGATACPSTRRASPRDLVRRRNAAPRPGRGRVVAGILVGVAVAPASMSLRTLHRAAPAHGASGAARPMRGVSAEFVTRRNRSCACGTNGSSRWRALTCGCRKLSSRGQRAVAILSAHSGDSDYGRDTGRSAAARRPSGRDAKRAARTARAAASVPYITRKIPYYEVLGEEGLTLLERNADTILEEVGIEFREDAEALALWKQAGADVQGERVRMPRPRALTRSEESPREFVQHARNPARNVTIGGLNTVFAPAYGSPFVRNLDEGGATRALRLSQFRQARLPLEFPAPLRRDHLRARRPGRQTSVTSRWCTPYQIQRQAVHGLGHPSGARPGLRLKWRRSSLAPTSWMPPPGGRRPSLSISSMPILR